ncbi:MAG: response regulator transcription factor [Gammaproteobacteria bacterium]|nr:response regulator transcription factor [Gammaproteobacteria bacterium]
MFGYDPRRMSDRQVYRALIVDDEPLGRRLIRTLLADHDDVEIVGEAGSVDEASGSLEGAQPDIVFLDVQMPGESGLDLLRRLGPDAPFVVFVTAHAQFAVTAFELHATDYLVKPLQRARFTECVNRVKRLVAQERMSDLAARMIGADSASQSNAAAPRPEYAQRLTFRVRRRVVALDVRDVTWVEGANQYCKVHSAQGEYLLSRSLAALVAELDPSRFFRIHRSAIINAAHLREVRSDGTGRYFVLLRSGEELPLGRARRGVLESLLASAVSEHA